MTATPEPHPPTRPRLDPQALYGEPNALAPHYSAFDVAHRLLLTGHSHQAWPDRALDGVRRAFEDAARLVDEKWEAAFERADRVRGGFARLLGEPRAAIALGQNTHELVARFLSALPLRDRPRLVTTTGEFHTIRRQLGRLAEEGVEVLRIHRDPVDTLAERCAAAVDDRTAGALVSSVLFLDARIVPHLDALAEACRRCGAELLVDAYHHLNVVPFSIRALGLDRAFVVGGGYKYCQLGEGNCFLRVPPDCRLRPVLTGWFAEFDLLETSPGDVATPYPEGAARFAGSTYDPTAHYRAAEVFDFFEEHALTPELLREVSLHQVGVLAAEFDSLDLDPAVVDRDRSAPPDDVGGFLALRSTRASELRERLRQRGVLADHRGEFLRLGPAPYLSDRQLRTAVAALR